jgi:hypothetical protein
VKDKVDGFGLASGNCEFLIQGTEQFMPSGECVFPWGQIGEREPAIVGRDGEVAGAKNDEVALHPSVDIALHVDEFLLLVGIGKRRGASRLDTIPLTVDFGEWMDIVRERITVGDADVLAHAEGEDMGCVSAIALVIGDSGIGGGRAFGRTVGDIRLRSEEPCQCR